MVDGQRVTLGRTGTAATSGTYWDGELRGQACYGPLSEAHDTAEALGCPPASSCLQDDSATPFAVQGLQVMSAIRGKKRALSNLPVSDTRWGGSTTRDRFLLLLCEWVGGKLGRPRGGYSDTVLDTLLSP